MPNKKYKDVFEVLVIDPQIRVTSDGKVTIFTSNDYLTQKINIELSSKQGRLKIERKNKKDTSVLKAEIETLKDILHLINSAE